MADSRVKQLLAIIGLLIFFQLMFIIVMGTAVFLEVSNLKRNFNLDFNLPNLSMLDKIIKLIDLIPEDKLQDIIIRCEEMDCVDRFFYKVKSWPKEEELGS